MPGFIGVGAGKWGVPGGTASGEAEVYIIADVELWRAKPGGELELLTVPFPSGQGMVRAWSHLLSANVRVLTDAGPADLHIWTSADGGATWQDLPTEHAAERARRFDDLYVREGGAVWRSETGGTTWSQLFTLAGVTIERIELSTTHLYADVAAEEE